MLEIVVSIMVLVGAFFTFVGSVGFIKLPDFFMRLHGPTKATTLGVGSMLIASSVYFSSKNGEVSLHEVLITLFLFISAPVGAHLMAKAALHIKLKKIDRTKNPDVNGFE